MYNRASLHFPDSPRSKDKVFLPQRHRLRCLRRTEHAIRLDPISLGIDPHARHGTIEFHVLFPDGAAVLDCFDAVPEVVGAYCAGGEGGGGDECYAGGGDEGLFSETERLGELVLWGLGACVKGGKGKGRRTANIGRMMMGWTVGIEAFGSPWREMDGVMSVHCIAGRDEERKECCFGY